MNADYQDFKHKKLTEEIIKILVNILLTYLSIIR